MTTSAETNRNSVAACSSLLSRLQATDYSTVSEGLLLGQPRGARSGHWPIFTEKKKSTPNVWSTMNILVSIAEATMNDRITRVMLVMFISFITAAAVLGASVSSAWA